MKTWFGFILKWVQFEGWNNSEARQEKVELGSSLVGWLVSSRGTGVPAFSTLSVTDLASTTNRLHDWLGRFSCGTTI